MRDALAITSSGSWVVSASDFDRRAYWGAQLYCPHCHQPVHFAAGKYQSAHFRHEQNNPRAHECDLFQQGYEAYAPFYKRIPLPMVLVSTGPDIFVLQGLFHPVSNQAIEMFQGTQAKLCLGTREYLINRSRFPEHLTAQLEFGLKSLRSVSEMRLSNTPPQLAQYWVPPEPVAHCALFSTPEDSPRGKRLRKRDCVYSGEKYLALVDKSGVSRLPRALRPKRAGVIRNCDNLLVYSLSMPSLTEMRTGAVGQWIRSLELIPAERSDELSILWPPCVGKGGAGAAIFKSNRLQVACTRKAIGNGESPSLYVLRSNRFGEEGERHQLEKTGRDELFVGQVYLSDDFALIGTQRGVFDSDLFCSGGAKQPVSIVDSELAMPRLTESGTAAESKVPYSLSYITSRLKDCLLLKGMAPGKEELHFSVQARTILTVKTNEKYPTERIAAISEPLADDDSPDGTSNPTSSINERDRRRMDDGTIRAEAVFRKLPRSLARDSLHRYGACGRD